MKAYRLWAAAALVTVALQVDAGEPLTIVVSPRQSFGPTNLTVRVRVEPNADNRTLEVVADSAGFYRSSEIELDGERAPRTVVVEFRGVPGGAYEIYGLLNRARGERTIARQQAIVLSPGGDR